jgi:hypothetical protein
MKDKLFISCPMTGVKNEKIKVIRESINFIVSIMIGYSNIELIDQFEIFESPDMFVGYNDNQIRQTRLNRSLNFMKDANIIVFARDWWKSPGCVEEYLQYRMYQDGALCIMGDTIEEVMYNLYGITPETPYDVEAQSKMVSYIDSIVGLINKPKTIKLIKSDIVLQTSKTSYNIKSIEELEPEVDNNESYSSFRDYVDQYIGEDKKYFVLLQETLTNIFLEEIQNQYGKRKSKVTINFVNINNKYVCSINVFPTNDEKISYEFESDMYSTKDENSEYLDGYMFINIHKNNKYLQAFRVNYISSQISPVSDDRVSQSVKIGYVTTAKISDKIARKVLSQTNKRFKEFVVDRDDMEYYNLGNL